MDITQGYKHQKAYIIAEGPMESTARNMWKMVYDRKCGAIVMLSQLIENGNVRQALCIVNLSVLFPLGEQCAVLASCGEEERVW